jgi:hypothetical protein
MLDGLGGVKNDKGTVVFVRRKCGSFPEQAYGAQNTDQLVHILMRTKCGRVFGEWAAIEARDNELREFAKRVKLMT